MIKPLLTYWKAVECLWLIPMECHQFRSRLPSFGCPVTRWKSLVARQTSRLKKRRFTTHLGTFQKSNPSNSLFPIKSIGCGRHQRYLNQISGWYFFNSILWKMPISVAHRNLQHFPFINNGVKTEKNTVFLFQIAFYGLSTNWASNKWHVRTCIRWVSNSIL